MPQTRRQVCKLLVRALACAAAPVALERPVEATGRRPRFNIIERYHRKLVCTGRGAQRVCETVEAGRFRLLIRVPLVETDISTFNASTPIAIKVEETEFTFTLGDDPTYITGRPRARITRTAPGPNGDPLAYQTVLLKWDRKAMQISLDALTPELVEPLFGWDFIDAFTGRHFDTTVAAVTVGEFVITFQLDLFARTSSRTVTRQQEEFEISSTEITSKVFSDDWTD
ncbi:MAG: hypothetical protein ACO1SX_04110 [Actinomycetota bacterium]